ncbi:phosphoesterase [Burkholderia sp. PAMC 28687]|uniref:phosphatase PAP2 family protein n=1 Tax=Burkholderia sp. PAMC 28687 TaxID=1795874 RepID=UPI00078020AE|nr:phosphatase PAP2 family protein [Burkholderia sp. PAMC 28687]AMM17157.1 phosphoesterase [Burkholderia sp. PAMC 28687]
MPDLPLSLWLSITSVGSVGVMIPLAIVVAVWLALGYPWRYAACWLLVLGGASGLVFLTKLAFMGWGIGVRELDFTGISGHAMISSAVLPVALFVACLPERQWVRALGVVLGLLIGIVVGVSRILLNAHSLSEVVTGCGLGALTALLFVAYAWRAESGKLSPAPVAVSLAIVAVVLHGIPVPTQRWITDIALQLSGRDQPFIRARWKAGQYDKPAAAPARHIDVRFGGPTES